MRHRTKALLLGFVVLVTTSCGYHLRGSSASNTLVPKDLQTLTLSSYDQYGPLTRAVRQQRDLTDEPGLEGLLDEIETRAAVEIAKLEVAATAA